MNYKNLLTSTLALMLVLIFAAPAQAQLSRKERKQLDKQMSQEEKALLKKIRTRADKSARKEAKTLSKEGYGTFPGSLPMEKQLQETWMMQLQRDETGALKYIFADGNGVGGTQTSAEMQAMEAAKLQLAGQISNEVNQIIEGKIANDQIDRETANSLTKFVAGSKNYIIQNLSYVKPSFKVMREVGKRNLEVAVKVFYNVEEAMAAAKKAMEARARADLEEEADELIEEIDNLFKK
ncbi:MAG: hypothetical protein AAGI38_02540 [Bacteroidota bacterium]